MEIERINVTPKMAAKWLDEINISNRRLSNPSVSKYADDMKSGTWYDTHQNVIAFYEDGSLADGQHRLLAVVESGVDVEMTAFHGLSRIAGSVIDQGRSRTAVDGLMIGGLIEDSKYLTAKVAIIKLLNAVETGKQEIISISATADFLGELGEGLEFSTSRLNHAPVGINNAVARAALTTAFYCVSAELAERFARVLVSGMAETPLDVSIIRLRNWLLQNRGQSSKMRVSTYMTILRVLNACEKGRTLGVIRRTEKLYYKIGVFGDE